MIPQEIIDKISLELGGEEIHISAEDIAKALDPINFVNIRKVTGGPAPEEVERMLQNRNNSFIKDIEYQRRCLISLEESEKLLNQAVASILNK